MIVNKSVSIGLFPLQYEYRISNHAKVVIYRQEIRILSFSKSRPKSNSSATKSPQYHLPSTIVPTYGAGPADRIGVPFISAKLFCKNLQVKFMTYGVVLRDERRTSNHATGVIE